MELLKFCYLWDLPETKKKKGRLLSTFIINQKSFIMKKTVLTLAMAFALLAVNANTETGVHYNNFTTTIGSKITKPGPDSFCKAIMEGDVETVQRMIELGENVNKKSLGKTPAIFAARYNKPEIMKILIANGADLSIKCDNGYTVEKYAELSNASDVLKVLAEDGQHKNLDR